MATVSEAKKPTRRQTGRKAADHAGTVRKVREAGRITRPDGKIVHRSEQWQGRVMIDGTRHVVYGPTEGAALTALEERKAELRKGTYSKAEKRTVAQLLDDYITDGAARGLKPKTLFFYRQARDRYVGAELKRIRLGDLRPEHIRRWVNGLASAGLGSTSIRNTRAVLNAALEFAVRQEWIGRNVCHSVKPPKRVRPTLRPPTPAEMGRLIDAAEEAGDRLAALWTLAAHAGCRPGELLALRWSDVDLDSGVITVARNQSKVPGEAVTFQSTKTDRVRRVRVAPDAVASLRAHRKAQLAERLVLGADYEDHGLVFALETGAPLLERHAVTRFKQALTRAELPLEIRFYDMRHGNATLMLLAGIQPKAAAERLGHTSVQLFNDTYSHMLEEIDADVAAKLGAALARRSQAI
ncbi:MAG: site-specific integrase [Chloroflexota bacterium]